MLDAIADKDPAANLKPVAHWYNAGDHIPALSTLQEP